MKRIAATIAVIILVLVLAGCGGGDTSTSADTSGTPGATATAPGAPAAATAPAAPEKTIPRAFEKKTSTPAFFIDALNKDQPIVVLFYGADEISQEVLSKVKVVMDDKYYGGGAMFMLMKLDENNDVKKLERDFSIGYVPYLAVVNRTEQIIFEKNGYFDSKVLEQAVYNAMNK